MQSTIVSTIEVKNLLIIALWFRIVLWIHSVRTLVIGIYSYCIQLYSTVPEFCIILSLARFHVWLTDRWVRECIFAILFQRTNKQESKYRILLCNPGILPIQNQEGPTCRHTDASANLERHEFNHCINSDTNTNSTCLPLICLIVLHIYSHHVII